MGFSERYGYKPVRLELQVDSLDPPTINALWNTTYGLLLNRYGNQYDSIPNFLESWFTRLWMHSFGGRLDRKPRQWSDVQSAIESVFFTQPWHSTLSLIEDIARDWPDDEQVAMYRKVINSVLEDNLVGYRFVGTEIIRVSDTDQAEAVEAAQKSAKRVPAARDHLTKAVTLINDRKTPNYAKSVQESISAVEAVARQITGDDKATLGKALKKVSPLHPALERAWTQLYGFTSDSGGIRHAATADGQPVDQALALYFLVTCSAFVSYLLSEAQA